MQGIVLVMMMAVTVEALVEYGRTAVTTARGNGRMTALLQGLAILLSVGMCLLTGADLYATVGITFSWAPLGRVLTGIFAARGSNYVSDLTDKLHLVMTPET